MISDATVHLDGSSPLAMRLAAMADRIAKEKKPQTVRSTVVSPLDAYPASSRTASFANRLDISI